MTAVGIAALSLAGCAARPAARTLVSADVQMGNVRPTETIDGIAPTACRLAPARGAPNRTQSVAD
jgi:hypothetical protein